MTKWHVKLKGIEGYHPLKEVKDLGPGKGNAYVLENGQKHHQSKIEDMRPAPETVLEKGSAQRRIPFDPHKIDVSNREKSEQWAAGNKESREGVPRLEGNSRLRALAKLHGHTQVRRNAQTGEREFLLYRGPTEDDFFNGGAGHHGQYNPKIRERSSFTANPEVAKNFNFMGLADLVRNGHLKNDDRMKDLDWSVPQASRNLHLKEASKRLGHVISAWVPESQIHHIPNAWGETKRAGVRANKVAGSNLGRREQEVIVNTSGLQTNKIPFDQLAPISEAYDKHRAAVPYQPPRPKAPEKVQKAVTGWWKQNRERLAKGKHGDWQKEGYQVKVHPNQSGSIMHPADPSNTHFFHMTAHDRAGNEVGRVTINGHSGRIWARDVEVDKNHRRKGIATAMYRAAEKASGSKMEIHDRQLRPGKALWAQKNRPFGKSAETSTGLKKSYQVPQVASVLCVDGNKILMGLRSDSNLWTLPGGHAEFGEFPRKAAARELAEETGIVNQPLHYMGSYKVRCEDGVDRLIHCYVVYGSHQTDTSRDPDHECAKFEYIDISNGLPPKVAENLHVKNNIIFQKIGLI